MKILNYFLKAGFLFFAFFVVLGMTEKISAQADVDYPSYYCSGTEPRVDLTWHNNNVGGVKIIERRTASISGSPWSSWVRTGPSTSYSVRDGQSFTITVSLQRGLAYQFRAATAGSSRYPGVPATDRQVAVPENACTPSTPSPEPTPPPTQTAPTNVSIALLCVSNSPRINVSWGANDNVAGYSIERRQRLSGSGSYGSWEVLGSTSNASFVDNSLQRGRDYQYRVRSYRTMLLRVYGPYSSVVTRSIAANYCPPPTPTNISTTLTCVNNTPRITVSWSAVSGVSFYQVEYRHKAVTASTYGAWSSSVSGSTSLSYSDNQARNRDYQFRVRSQVGNRYSSYSAIVSTRVSGSYCPPAVPVNLTTALLCNLDTGIPRITVSWSSVPGANRYLLERREKRVTATNYTGWVQASSVAGTSFTDQNRLKNMDYQYRIRSRAGTTATSAYSISTTRRVASSYCPAPRFYISPSGGNLGRGESRTFTAIALRNNSSINDDIGLSWSISSNDFENLSLVANLSTTIANHPNRSTTLAVTDNCELLGDGGVVILTARNTNNILQGANQSVATVTIRIRSCAESAEEQGTTTINGLIIGNDIELDGSNISIIYDGRIISSPPLGFFEIFVPNIREGR